MGAIYGGVFPIYVFFLYGKGRLPFVSIFIHVLLYIIIYILYIIIIIIIFFFILTLEVETEYGSGFLSKFTFLENFQYFRYLFI